MKISVIVCTHNRCNDLMRTLDSLASQDYPTSHYEVLVVDNRSTDRTKDVVDEFIRKVNNAVNIRYVFEEKIGLSHAGISILGTPYIILEGRRANPSIKKY